VFHVDIPNMCFDILSKGKQCVIDFVFNLNQLRPNKLSTLTSRSNFAPKEVDIESVKNVPIIMRLSLICAYLRILFKDTNKILLVFTQLK
jgi:hypothetical protein